MFAVRMSKLTAIAGGVVSAFAFAPWLIATLHGGSLGWWSAALVYPGIAATIVLVVAVVRDVVRRRYWALVVPVIAVLVTLVGLVIWVEYGWTGNVCCFVD